MHTDTTTPEVSLTCRAMLAALSISQWYARKHDRERIDNVKSHPWRTALLLLLLGAGPALLLAGGVWLTYGRERKTGYDREYEQAPPTETEPALVPSLVRQETAPGSNEFTATLFDLIRRGRYTSSAVTTERKLWGGLRHEDVADLQLAMGDTSVPLTDFEAPVAEVVDAVLTGGEDRLSEFRESTRREPLIPAGSAVGYVPTRGA